MLASMVTLIGSAFGLYAIKYDTRLALERTRGLERQIAETTAKLAILTAEEAALTRPERIETLSRRHLDLQPMQPAQLAIVADLPWRTPDLSSQATAPALPVVPP